MPAMAGPLDREFTSQLAAPILRMLPPAEAAALAHRFELPADWAGRRTLNMPLRVFQQFTAEAAQRLNDPSLGLHLAQNLPRGSYGALEFTLRSAPNIREAIDRLRRYSALLDGLISLTVTARGARAKLIHAVTGAPEVNGRIGNEYAMALAVRLLRELSGNAFTPTEVWFAHAAHGQVSELEAFFGTASIEFGKGENGFAFASTVLELPVALLAVVEEQAQRLVLSRQVAADFPGEVREQARRFLQSSSLGIEQVAQAMHLSERTLQRRLKEHGTTFLGVLDSLRAQLALEYIDNPKLALGEIAYLLGYAELTVFIRCFKRWTGTTPGDYRKSERRAVR